MKKYVLKKTAARLLWIAIAIAFGMAIWHDTTAQVIGRWLADRWETSDSWAIVGIALVFLYFCIKKR